MCGHQLTELSCNWFHSIASNPACCPLRHFVALGRRPVSALRRAKLCNSTSFVSRTRFRALAAAPVLATVGRQPGSPTSRTSRDQPLAFPNPPHTCKRFRPELGRERGRRATSIPEPASATPPPPDTQPAPALATKRLAWGCTSPQSTLSGLQRSGRIRQPG